MWRAGESPDPEAVVTVIHYSDSVADIAHDNLRGFFVDWPNPPSAATHLELLAASDHIVLATEYETGAVIGFVTAISDGVLGAHVSFLEVLPAYQGRGIGTELFRRMLERLDGLYGVSLSCDPELRSFYERFGMRPANAMMLRKYDR